VSGEFLKIRAGKMRGYLNPDYDSDDVREFLKNPDRALVRGAELLKDSPTTTAAFVKVGVGGTEKEFHLKRANNKGFLYSLESLAKKSRPLRTYKNIMRLMAADIPTPTPVAAVEERRFGILKRSFLITERITGGANFYYWLKANFRNLPELDRIATTKGFAAFVRKIHLAGITHGDLKCSNVIILPEERPFRFFITDLDATRFSKNGWPLEAAVTEIARLSLSAYDTVDAEDRERFLKSYFDDACDADGWGEKNRFRRMAAIVMKKHLARQRRKKKYPEEYFTYFETGAGKCPSD